jgi:hypothetical protein
MTALDPNPVLPSRRQALDLLESLREQLADFLDRPSTDGLSGLTAALQSFVLFETTSVLTEEVLDEFAIERVDALAAGHDALAERVNLLCWALPGSSEAQTAAHQLRHEVLSQIDRYQSLRLPRGALISGSD